MVILINMQVILINMQVFAFLFSVLVSSVMGANVLMFVTLSTRSHKLVFLPLAKEMVNRGHTITLVTALESEDPLPGIREIVLPGVEALMAGSGAQFPPGEEPKPKYSLSSTGVFRRLIGEACENILSNHEIQDVIEGKEKYDLVVLSLLFEDCALGITKVLELPFVFISTFSLPVEYTNNMRIPSCMTYCPMSCVHGYTNRMTFMERLKNSLSTIATTCIREWAFASVVDEIIQKRLGDLPPVLDIEKNFSLILVNDHFSLTYARPILPSIIDVPCMYCRPAKPLPKELQEWVDGSGDAGFIYFSLGTMVHDYKMPQHLLDVFVQVFSSLKQRVVWKISLDTISDLPTNVKIFKWLPQQDLLGHPKIRLFLSHGGMLSIQEATYHAVPILGFPVTIEQPYNMRATENAGAGIMMNWKNVTVRTLQANIDLLLNDPIYKKNVKRRQEVFRDLPMAPLDTAIYWIEYVIRHKGAPQLRTGGLDLTWYQYNQLDILAFLVFVVVLFVLLLFGMWRCCRNIHSLLKYQKKKRQRSKKD